jgi:nucleotide-binding universal stress UspA family protein
MFRNILIPTDGSELAQKAAVQGVALARAVGARVTGFFAAPPATPIVYRHHFPVGFAQPADNAELIEKASAQHLGFIEQVAKEAEVPFEGLHRTDDFPAHAILEVADKKGCDLIVMGTHGEGSRLSGMFIGSVAQKVINQAKIPVMVFR